MRKKQTRIHFVTFVDRSLCLCVKEVVKHKGAKGDTKFTEGL
jgi:hypothetical protein